MSHDEKFTMADSKTTMDPLTTEPLGDHSAFAKAMLRQIGQRMEKGTSYEEYTRELDQAARSAELIRTHQAVQRLLAEGWTTVAAERAEQDAAWRAFQEGSGR